MSKSLFILQLIQVNYYKRVWFEKIYIDHCIKNIIWNVKLLIKLNSIPWYISKDLFEKVAPHNFMPHNVEVIPLGLVIKKSESESDYITNVYIYVFSLQILPILFFSLLLLQIFLPSSFLFLLPLTPPPSLLVPPSKPLCF